MPQPGGRAGGHSDGSKKKEHKNKLNGADVTALLDGLKGELRCMHAGLDVTL